MAQNNIPQEKIMTYYGADPSLLMNFYMEQKKQELIREHEQKTKQMVLEQNKIISQPKLESINYGPMPLPEPEQPIKKTMKIEDDEEFKLFEKSLVPCDLHPIKPSANCRKCKKIKESRIGKLYDLLKDRRSRYPDIIYTSKEISVPNQAPEQNNQDSELVNYSGFPTYGDPIACNMNDLLRTNIINAQYYNQILALTTYEEICSQIEYYCTHAEPFTLGTINIPSTLFCCLYRLMMMKLNEDQIKNMLDSENPYVRATAALYIRYIGKPEELWKRLGPYIFDEQLFSPSTNAEEKITFGEYIEKLLGDLNYYGTRLPRPPILVEKDLKKKLALLPKKRERAQFNKENFNLLTKDAECYVLSNKDLNWHLGAIIMPDTNNMKSVKVKVYKDNEKDFSEEEIVDLGSVILSSCIKDESNETNVEDSKVSHSKSREKSRKRSKSRSRSRSHSRHHEKSHRHHHSHHRDHHRKSRSRSRSRSHEKSKKRSPTPPKKSIKPKSILDKLNEENTTLIQEAFDIEREQFVASSRGEYARRPVSYKSALSLLLPVGTVRRKSKSASPSRKVVEIKLESHSHKTKTEEIEAKARKIEKQQTAADYERMQKIKEKYGIIDQNAHKIQGKKASEVRGGDDIGPESFKFGVKK